MQHIGFVMFVGLTIANLGRTSSAAIQSITGRSTRTEVTHGFLVILDELY